MNDMKKLLTILALLLLVVSAKADGSTSLIANFQTMNESKCTYVSSTGTMNTTEGWNGIQDWIGSDNPSASRLVVNTSGNASLCITVGYTDNTAHVFTQTSSASRILQLDNKRTIQKIQIVNTEVGEVVFTDISIDDSTEGNPEVVSLKLDDAFTLAGGVSYETNNSTYKREMTTTSAWTGVSFSPTAATETKASCITVNTDAAAHLKVAVYYNDGWASEYFDDTSATVTSRVLKLDPARTIGSIQIQNEDAGDQTVSFSEISLSTPESPSYNAQNACKAYLDKSAMVFDGNSTYNSDNGQLTINAGKTATLNSVSKQGNNLNIGLTSNAKINVKVTYSDETIDTYNAGNEGVNSRTLKLQEKVITKIEIENTEESAIIISGLTLDEGDNTSSEAAMSKYAVTINSTTGGTFTVKNGETTISSGDEVDENTQLTLTATPDATHYFSNWIIGDDATQTANPYSYTVTGAVTIGATFAERITPTIQLSSFTAGENATLESGVFTTTADGKTIGQWIGLNSGVTGNKLVVKFAGAPTGVEEQSIKVAAEYIADTYTEAYAYADANNVAVVELDPTKYIKSIYIQLTKAGSVTINSIALDPEYTLAYSSNDNTKGSVAVSPSKEKYSHGESVTLTATANSGYMFSKWKQDDVYLEETNSELTITLTGSTSIVGEFVGNTSLFDAGASDIMGQNKASYNSETKVMNVTEAGNGIQRWIGGESTVGGSAVVLRYTPSASVSINVEYTDGSADNFGYKDATERILKINSAKKIKVLRAYSNTTGDIIFSQAYISSDAIDGAEDPESPAVTKYKITVTAEHGTIKVVDGETETDYSADTEYESGTSVTLKAYPDENYTFTKWQQGTTESTDNPLTVTMDADKAITAVFIANPVVTPVFDANGKADLSKFGADTGATYTYNSTSSEGTITIGDEAWKGISLSIPADEQFQAAKLKVKFKEAAPAYMHVTYEGETSWIGNEATHDKSGNGTELVLSLDHSKKVTTIHIQLTEANKSAVLKEVSISNKCTLTVSATNGSVTVKNGETTTTDTEFDYGTSLTLTATPASSDYSFKQWVIGETTKTDNPYTFTITGDTEITAEFKSADPDVIWLGSQAINWNSGISQAISVTEDDNLKIADCLVFTITPTVEGIEWPQIQLSSKSEGTPVLIGSSNTAITESTTEVKYCVTKAMLNDITTNGGLVVSGIGFTLTKVKIERGNGGSGYENAIWIGEKVFPSDWSVYQTIGKDLFANAAVGDVIRLKYKDVKAGSSINFSYENEGWKTLPDATATTADGTATKLMLTNDMLTALNAGGLIISGVNFTLTSVDLFDGSSIKELTCSVPVTGDDWVWTSSETPEFNLNVENKNNEAVTADAQLIITTDKLVAYKTLTQSKEIAANGSETLTFKLEGDNKPTTPGFYRATIIVNDETVRAFNFGYAPTEIVSAPDKQNDFDSYWAAAKTQLNAVIASDSPVLTEMTDKSTSRRKVYLVELKSIPDGTSGDPVTIRGYYCEPTDGEKHPVLMHYQGYDSFTYGPGGTAPAVYCPGGDDNPDYAEFVISTRGQVLNNREPFNDNPYGQDGWFKANFGDKDKYYYRGAYMDVVRAIEFMATRETSDMDNLFAEGQSQGGAFTYAAAALSGRTFKAIAPAITFMGDFPDYFDIVSWPGNEAKEMRDKLGWTDDQMYAFLSYYDTKNLATKVSCPVITSIGVQDNVCPPHTNIAPYNNLPTSVDKEVIFNAELYHATNDQWNDTYMAFFDKYSTWVNPHQPGEISLYDLNDGWSSSYDMATHTITTTADWAARGWKVGDDRYNDKGSITVKFQAVDFPVTLKMVYINTNNDEKSVQAGAAAGETEIVLDIPTDVKTINTVHITYEKAGTLVLTAVSVNEKVVDNRTEKTLVEKTQAISAGDIEINRGLFSNAVVGDVIRIYATGLSATSKIALATDYDSAFDGANWTEFTESPFALKLTASLISKVQEKNLLIRGENFTFKKAVLYTESELGNEIIDIKSYTLTIQTPQNGTITVKRGNEQVSGGSYDEGTVLTLTAVPNDGFQFVKWTKNGADAGTESTLTITMDSDVDIAAFFEEIPKPVIDEETGETDLSTMTAQDETTTVTYDEETETVTMTTTEPDKGVQIWFDTPEQVKGNVLLVDIAEANVTVSVTVRYTDGTQSSMTSTAAASQRTVARRAASNGTTIAVPVETGKQVQCIEVKNAEAGVIHITKMAVIEKNVFDENGKADLSMGKAQSNATYDTSTYTLATTKGWTGLSITPLETEEVKGVELMVKFASKSQVKVAVTYSDDEGSEIIMEEAAPYVKMTLDGNKNVKDIMIQTTTAAIIQLTEVAVNQTATPDELPEPVFSNGKADLSRFEVQDANKVMYNAETYKMATTDGWVGVQMNTSEAESVSGAELAVSFTEAVKVKLSVTYKDGTQADTISAQAQQETRLLLDATKSIQQIQVQPTEAGALQFVELVVRQTPTPDPEPVYLFNEQGEADLTMFQAMDDNASYDTTTYQITTSQNWAGIQAWLENPQSVSGNMMSVKLIEESANIRVTIGYTDGTESAADGSKAIATETGTEILVPNDATKEIQKIMIQVVEKGSVTLQSITGIDYSVTELEEGETRLLWKNSQGVELHWNNICEQDAVYGALLKEDQQLCITITSRDEDNEWPKVFIRDINNQEVGEVVELNSLKQFPSVVRLTLTAEMVSRMADGFSICGDGITVNRVELYQPYAPQAGDINLKELNGGWNATYDAASHTITTTARWAARGWDIGDSRYNSYDLIQVKFLAVDFPVTLKMEYTDANGNKQATSTGVSAGNTTLQMPIPENIQQIDKVYLIWQQPASLTLTAAEVLSESDWNYPELMSVSTDIRYITHEGESEKWYDLNGRRVEQPSKGVFIKNGKKTVISK